MNSSYISSSNSQSVKGKNRVLCNHNLEAVVKIVRKGRVHSGKTFYGCPLWPDNPCGFFQLVEDAMLGSSSMSTGYYNEDIEKKNLVEKVKKLEMKKARLKKDITELTIEISKHRKSEKRAVNMLLVSWILFALCWVWKTSV